MTESEPIEPVKLRNADEKQCWIAVYAQNSDNDEMIPVEIARWADAAILELRKRYP